MTEGRKEGRKEGRNEGTDYWRGGREIRLGRTQHRQ